MHRKIVFVKVISSVIELSKSVQIQTLLRYKFYKRLKWNVIVILKNSQPNDILSTYGYPSSAVHHIREIR